MEENFLQKATDPHQYDSAAMNWEKEGLKDSPTRLFFQEYLKDNLDVSGKNIVDIGSGMGQLFPLLKQSGAAGIKGIEPSVHNVEVSKKLYPDVEIFTGTLQEAPETEKYQAAASVMVFEHISNLPEAFAKISKILATDGRLYLVVADRNYSLTPRFDYDMVIANNEDGSAVVKTTRPLGVIYDILRPLEDYIAAAGQQGFILEKSVPLLPNKVLISKESKYQEFSDHAIAHLLILKKID